MSGELHKFSLDMDQPERDSGKVPNNPKKGFVQGYPCTSTPYILCLQVQSGKMSPYHKGKTGNGNVSGVEVVFDMLLYVDISCENAKGRQKHAGRTRVLVVQP